MAEVTVTLANRYQGHNPGDTIRMDEQDARQLRRGGIAVDEDPKATRKHKADDKPEKSDGGS